MSHLYFNDESDYSEENTCENEVFRSTILHHRKKLNVFTLQLPIYYIQYQNRKSHLMQMRTLQKRSDRKKLSLLQRGGCNAYRFGQNPRTRGKYLAIQLISTSARLLVTRVSLIQLVDEFFFLFLVQLNEIRRQGEFKVLSFCFWC